jgi:hypothetical protein
MQEALLPRVRNSIPTLKTRPFKLLRAPDTPWKQPLGSRIRRYGDFVQPAAAEQSGFQTVPPIAKLTPQRRTR